MKRSRSLESSPVHEQHRTSLAPLLLPLARQQANPLEYLVNSEPFEYLPKHCGIYNRLFPFAPDPHLADGTTVAYHRGAKSETTIREISRLVLEFTAKLEVKFAQLEGEVEDFGDSLRDVDQFYERGDVFSLTWEEYDELLDPAITQRWDIDKFIAYVSRIMPEAVEKERLIDGSGSFSLSSERDTFFNKCLLLIQIIIDRGRRKETFRILVLLKFMIREVNARLWYTKTSLQQERVDRIIKAFVDDIIPASMASMAVPGRRPLKSGDVEAEGLSWTPIASDADGPFYWDFASTVRPLRTAYMDRLCSYDSVLDQVDAPERDGSSGCCFHQKSIQLLDWLQTRAWSELRANVFLTIGTILPPELTEYVFECALEAQGVPSNPKTYETYPVEPPSWLLDRREQWGSKRKVQPRKCKRTKAAYKCWFIEDPNPDRVFTEFSVDYGS